VNTRTAAALLAAAAVLWRACPARADVLFMNDGRELDGRLVRIDGGTATLRADGRDRGYALKDILKAKLVRSYGVRGEDAADKIQDPTIRALLKSPPKPSDYPDDGEVVALDDRSCVIGRDARAVCTHRKVAVVLRERAKEKAANAKFYYLKGVEDRSIDWARSINGDKVSDLDDNSVEEGSEYSSYPEYDRLRSLKFAMPDVATGTIVDYRVRVDAPVGISTQPFAVTHYFRSFEPARLVRFSIVAPKDFPLAEAEWGMPKGVTMKREDLGDRVRLTWEARDVPSFKPEHDLPPFARLSPHVTVAPASTWPAVADAVASLIAPRLDAGPDVKALAARLTRGKRSDAAKVEALFDWVARRIKRESVSMDAYSYAPKSPEEILHAKAGDDLDKPFFLFVLLREAGFKPQLAYMKTKNDAPFKESVPTLGQFYAASVLLDLGGKRLFLAPFSDTRRWDEVPNWLQGVHGLIVYGPEKGRTFENPLADAALESDHDELRLSLAADGSLSGTAVMRTRGEDQAGWRSLRDWKKQDVDRYFEKMIHGIHPNARLVSYSVSGLDSLTTDLTVRTKFRIKDYALTASGGYMAFRLPWVGGSAWDVGKPDREQPMFWWARDLAVKKVSVALPRGWRIYSAPESVSLAGPGGASYRAAYARRGGRLDFVETARRDGTELAPSDYPRYKAYREDSVRFTRRWIVLKKKAG
jgi:hypothetical protein